MGRLVASGVAGVLVVGALVGCGPGGGVEPEGLSASPTPTEQVFTDELGVVYDFSDPDLGIYFEDVPEHLTGDAADVQNAIALMTRELWRSLSSNAVSPYVLESSSSAVIDSIAAALADEGGGRSSPADLVAGHRRPDFDTDVTVVDFDFDVENNAT